MYLILPTALGPGVYSATNGNAFLFNFTERAVYSLYSNGLQDLAIINWEGIG
jgi:hypothetical protein